MLRLHVLNHLIKQFCRAHWGKWLGGGGVGFWVGGFLGGPWGNWLGGGEFGFGMEDF